jgi:hypothetical protein
MNNKDSEYNRRIVEAKDRIKSRVTLETIKPIGQLGGQSCGMPNYPIVLKSPELDLEIKFGYHRLSLKNKEHIMLLFELTLDELIQ